ncbi:MAG: NADH-quinone oxidoreductase subunit C [Planctomycetes bacterium]|nr:NADH-quinone oxidoreductase subunit C [Planctomycetota bacterium]
MDFQGIHDHLRAIEAPGLVRADEPRLPNPEDKKDKGRSGDAYVVVEAAQLASFLRVCRDDERLAFEILADLTAADPAKDAEEFWVIVQLLSVQHRHRLAIKALVPKASARIPSATGVYRAAQWHERECAEMFGIEFVGHPDPRNILLPDDWEGYPLRKDYVFPTEYRGISCQ